MVRVSWLLGVVALLCAVPWAEAMSATEPGGRGPVGIVRRSAVVEPAGNARVEVQIGRTRRLLEIVGGRVERCGAAEARRTVRRAIEMQDRAESAARAGRTLGALQLTRGAREQGIEALRLCEPAKRAPDAAVSALGRTDELLALARQRRSAAVREGGAGAGAAQGSGGTDETLERAAAVQQAAHEEFLNGRFEESQRLTQDARRTLRADASLGRARETSRPAWSGSMSGPGSGIQHPSYEPIPEPARTARRSMSPGSPGISGSSGRPAYERLQPRYKPIPGMAGTTRRSVSPGSPRGSGWSRQATPGMQRSPRHEPSPGTAGTARRFMNSGNPGRSVRPGISGSSRRPTPEIRRAPGARLDTPQARDVQSAPRSGSRTASAREVQRTRDSGTAQRPRSETRPAPRPGERRPADEQADGTRRR